MANQKAIDIIKKFEGFRNKAYKCPAGIWTIGFGTTYYRNGDSVKEGDIISKEDAESYLIAFVSNIEKQLRYVIKKPITDNQMAALISFDYNLGLLAFKNSTLLKKININPNDPTIANEFNKWINAAGKPLEGLKRRRKEESELYFS